MKGFGWEKCEVPTHLKALNDFKAATQSYHSGNCSLSQFGKTACACILLSERLRVLRMHTTAAAAADSSESPPCSSAMEALDLAADAMLTKSPDSLEGLIVKLEYLLWSDVKKAIELALKR